MTARQRFELLDAILSADIPRAEKKKAVAPTTVKVVAVYLWNRGDATGVSYPSVAAIAHDTHLDRRTVLRAIRQLKTAGFLTVKRPTGRLLAKTFKNRPTNRLPNVYTLKNPSLGVTTPTPQKPIRGDSPDRLGVTALSHGIDHKNNPYTTCDETPKKTDGKPASAHQQLIAYFVESWAGRFGGRYPMNGKKDGPAIKRILDAVDRDLGRAKRIVDAYLIDPDEWLKGTGHTLAILASSNQLPRYIAATAKPDNGETNPTEHPVIADAREKWPDDVAEHLADWQEIAKSVERDCLDGGMVFKSGAATGEQFRAKFRQSETARHAG